MALLATGVVVDQQTIYAAVWLNGVGRVLGSFPNTAAGMTQFVEQLDALRTQHRAEDIHLALEPRNGAELQLLHTAESNDWPITIPDPVRFKHWITELGYSQRNGTAGALPLARYAATFAAPKRHELPSDVAALHESLNERSKPLQTNDDLVLNSPTLAAQAQHLQKVPGITAPNVLPLLILLYRWKPTVGSGSLSLDAEQRSNESRISVLISWLRTLHPAAYLAIAVILLLRFVQLDTLPGDLYGDIAIIINYVEVIFEGEWPTYFDLSAGPLYHYLIAPLLWVTGLTYYGIKLASVITSLVTLALTYLLARDLVDEEFGLVAFFCTGVACWFLIFSRLGNSQILVPLLAVGSVALALRGVRYRQQSFLVAAALVAVGGLYTYPQSFIIPGVTGLVLCWIIWQEPRRPWRYLFIYATVCVLGTVPFLAIVYRDLDAFLSGYVGDKLPESTEWGTVLRENLWNGLLAPHVEGDRTFRSNPPYLPQLDRVSGVLFLVGVIFWLLPKQRELAPIVFIPFLLLQLPALLVRYTVEVPSASRTLGVVPFVGLLVAGGVRLAADGLRRWPASRHLVIYAFAITLLILNSYRYFVVYTDGLPNNNIAFGREIATYIDSLPQGRHVMVIGCCWGEAGQPHPYAIQYDIKQPRDLRIKPVEEVSCDDINALPRLTTIIWGLTDGLPAPQLEPCMAKLPRTLHQAASGEPVFFSADLAP